jgi:hypothetical protein
VFPTSWSLSIIHPLYKKSGSPTDPGNYRGISLLCCFGKVFTKILGDRMHKWIVQKRLLSEFQAGFRRGYSTVDQVFTLNSIIQSRRNKNFPTYVAFIDFKKAFDRVPREALWYILSKKGISQRLLNLLKSMYDSSKYAVRLERNKISPQFSSNVGVMQGCQLSPILFILFIEELVSYITKVEDNNAPCIGELECPLLLFADDVGIISTSIMGLRRMLQAANQFCLDFGMEVNVQKTKIVVFKRTSITARGEYWTYNGEQISKVDSFTYLGVVFKYNLNWDVHVDLIVNKANRAIISMQQFMRRVRGTNRIKLGLHLFDSMILPILLYGCEVFGFNKLDKLERVATRFYKSLLYLPRSAASAGVELVLGRSRIEVEIKYRILKYWLKIITKMNQDRIPHIAYQTDKQKADRGVQSWALDVKLLLDKLDLISLWEHQHEIREYEVKLLLLTLKQKISKHYYKQQIMDCLSLETTAHLPNLLTTQGVPFLDFKKIKAHGLRINLARLIMKCPGGMINYSELGKRCAACSNFLASNIFIHRLYECKKFHERRVEYRNKTWFHKGKKMPTYYFLTYLVKYKKFDSLNFFY